MVKENTNTIDQPIKAILESVSDPEIPVLSVWDLGIVRSVEIDKSNIHIKISPTYTGCPAMDTISVDLIKAFEEKGYRASVELVLAPAWTTDDISEEGRQKMKAYGIAPPLGESMDKAALINGARVIACTHCQSTNTKMISQFGSTACKALFQCEDCLEPFDYFKCLK